MGADRGSAAARLAEVCPPPVRAVLDHLHAHGHAGYVVGGSVRDALLGRVPRDWDLATDARPDAMLHLFPGAVYENAFGTVAVRRDGELLEITTFRNEHEYADFRRPHRLEFGDDIRDDLARRDFTVNAIAFDPLRGELVDPWGGLEDLDRQVIRAVGDPAARFGEDGLRVLRAARFAATLGFTLDPATEAAIAPSLDTFRKVSPERVHEEWRKALKSERPSPALVVMRRTGILAVTCAPLAELDDAAFARTMARVDRCRIDHELRLAALLCALRDLEWADEWLRAMRAANQERKRVLCLIAHARVPESDSLDDAGVRRWLSSVGLDAVGDVLELGRADGRDVGALRDRARAEVDRGVPLAIRDLPITGGDVMQLLGKPPGRYVGEVLEELLRRVLEDPSLADRERLLAEVPRVYTALEPQR
jgi:tRNA nucleotidyltransferase (CCA-adding enzyme)